MAQRGRRAGTAIRATTDDLAHSEIRPVVDLQELLCAISAYRGEQHHLRRPALPKQLTAA